MTSRKLVWTGVGLAVAFVLTLAAPEPARAQQHLIGEVTALDSGPGRITVRTDAGASVTFVTDQKTVFRRVPPGQRSLDNAVRITRADVGVGDRVLVPGGAPVEGAPAAQLIVMSGAALSESRAREREDWRRRGAAGRVVALDASKKEILIETRTREGSVPLTVVAGGDARFKRYAPDSLRLADVVPGSFADIRVGDQLRALGDRSPDGSRLTAEEVISGSVARLAGTILTVDSARGEVAVKENQTGRTVNVVIGQRTTVKRVPAEFSETLAERRARRRDAGGEGRREGARQSGQAAAREGSERPRRRAAGGIQQALESLPAITAAELKSGDAVLVTGTNGADAARVTAATVLTGDAGLLSRLQRFGRGPGGGGNMSPGLPGSVMGGGTGEREEPRD